MTKERTAIIERRETSRAASESFFEGASPEEIASLTPACDTRAALLAGIVYFLVVFASGFVLGTVRTLWLVPRVGERWAELAEMPLMLTVIVLAARWIDRRSLLHLRHPATATTVGLLALGLLLAAELGLVLQIRGLSLPQYLAERDPVSGTAYAVSLLLFAAMPTLVARWRRRGTTVAVL